MFCKIINKKIVEPANFKYPGSLFFDIDYAEFINKNSEGEYYIYDSKTKKIKKNPNYESEQAKKERERIDNLVLTGADVERAIFESIGFDFEDVITFIETNYPNIVNVKRLRIELKANSFYRKHIFVNQIGELLGYTAEELDSLFINKTLPAKTINTQTSNGTEQGAE